MKAHIPHVKYNWLCYDCNEDTWDEYYMIRDPLWVLATISKPAHLLCIGCVEHRLGRKLTKADFTNAPINDLNMGHSDRLLNRLLA